MHCWHCGISFIGMHKAPDAAASTMITVAGERHRVHTGCADEALSAPEVIAPHIFPEGPGFRRYEE